MSRIPMLVRAATDQPVTPNLPRVTCRTGATSARPPRGWIARVCTVLLIAAAGFHAGTGFAQQLLDLPSLPLSGVGRVEAMVVQGDGKIIIGGAFTYVSEGGADVRVNIARFNSNGTLDPTFNFKATSTIDALAIIGNTLYIGGDFTGLTKIGGASTLRNRLAAIDLPTLTITSFNPNMDGEVFALAASGTTLYVGGAFSFIGGGATQRIGAAAFNTALAGTPLTTWDPEPRDGNAPGPAFQGVVRSIAPFGSIVYVGGAFTQIGGLVTPVARDAIAAVDNNTGLATAWDPVASNGSGEAVVYTIVPTASVVYLGGQFSGLNGVGGVPFAQRLAIGAVSAADGVATAWNPGTPGGPGTVHTLLLDGTTIYAGGEFTMMGSAARNRVAGIDTTVVSITALARVNTTATATATSTAGLANGNFVTIVGATQPEYNGIRQITVVDATHFTFPVVNTATTPATGTISFAKNNNATAFNPILDDDVHAMALASPATTILLGGTYLKANGVANPSFGGFNKASGATTIAGYVYDVAAVRNLVRQPDGKTIVAGDFFTVDAGVFYRGLLRLNANDTLDTGWNPVVQGQVTSAVLGPIVSPATAPTTVLVGGTFTTIGATAIRRLAAVDLTTGAATAFNANVNATVNVVLLDGLTAYIGGTFTQVGGFTRNYAAAVDAVTGALQAFNPGGLGADDFVETLAVDASNVYLGGQFFSMGGLTRLHVAKVSKAGVVDAWNPGTNEIVFGLTVSGPTVYISGNFTGLGGGNGSTARNFTGAVNATTGAVLAFNPDPDFIVLKVVVPASPANSVYLAGAFLNVGGVGTGSAAAVNATTGAVLPWFSDVSDAVYDLLPDAARVMVGGVFVDVGGVTRYGLAAFTDAGLPDPPTNVVASPLNASASVSFTAPANNGGFALTGYTVTSIPAGGVDSNAGSLATTHVITGLTNGVAYTFTVKASNINGASVASAASNSVTPGAVTAPTLSSVVSRKVHGAVGPVTYDLPLNAVSTNPTTEPRGGANLIVFTFNKPVTAGSVLVTEGVATPGAATFSGNEMRVPLTSVNDQQYVTVTVSSVSAADGGTGGSGSVRVGYLLGDVNQSRVVSLADLGLVNAQVTQVVTAANYLKDVNISNTLSLADKGIVNSRVTKALPLP
ncbi:MAG: fibronectin type III domain-containing protein [Betaproteobacteria bacterium]